ncbi:HIT family protein [Actinomycetaceae bacterium WB03_NA08]|uniref:HIT family protein n=1 Tax=Scrofimicrobium canadense TaxID=2652290 RepID=A0A6N7VTB2_9ACTO|nr:HIT family protein [Scrofimicrobium canadense]MSS85009.1 HIT family protein [Scrofimicrobium canadense]
MSTIFESIMARNIPGEFIWEDSQCVAIMTIEPVSPGHALVIPREPVSKWTDLPTELLHHITEVSQHIGNAQIEAFHAPRAAVVIAGFEVPHTHIHVIPAHTEMDCLLSRATKAEPEELAAAADLLRGTLRSAGFASFIPSN